DGVLLPQQRGGGGRGGADAGGRPGADPRLGRAPRERDAGGVLGAGRRALPVGPPGSVLPGHRRGPRDPRAGRCPPHPQPPFPAGRSDADLGAAFHELFLPIALAFRPDLVIVSAGFDAHEDDPLGGMLCTERGFAAMCSAVKSLAEEVAGGRLVLLLEGGYSL